jgi:hypothetical protein
MVSNDTRRLGPFTNTDSIESSPRTPQAEAPLRGALCSHITRVDGVPVYFVLFLVKLWALFEEQPRGLRLCRTPTSFLFAFILLLSRKQLLSRNTYAKFSVTNIRKQRQAICQKQEIRHQLVGEISESQGASKLGRLTKCIPSFRRVKRNLR